MPMPLLCCFNIKLSLDDPFSGFFIHIIHHLMSLKALLEDIYKELKKYNQSNKVNV